MSKGYENFNNMETSFRKSTLIQERIGLVSTHMYKQFLDYQHATMNTTEIFAEMIDNLKATADSLKQSFAARGVTTENIVGILILLVALINAILQMFGIKTIPISNDEINNIVSTVFLIITTLYNTWKNRNFTKASQISQQITNCMKSGELLAEDVENIIEEIKIPKQLT